VQQKTRHNICMQYKSSCKLWTPITKLSWDSLKLSSGTSDSNSQLKLIFVHFSHIKHVHSLPNLLGPMIQLHDLSGGSDCEKVIHLSLAFEMQFIVHCCSGEEISMLTFSTVSSGWDKLPHYSQPTGIVANSLDHRRQKCCSHFRRYNPLTRFLFSTMSRLHYGHFLDHAISNGSTHTDNNNNVKMYSKLIRAEQTEVDWIQCTRNHFAHRLDRYYHGTDCVIIYKIQKVAASSLVVNAKFYSDITNVHYPTVKQYKKTLTKSINIKHNTYIQITSFIKINYRTWKVHWNIKHHSAII